MTPRPRGRSGRAVESGPGALMILVGVVLAVAIAQAFLRLW